MKPRRRLLGVLVAAAGTWILAGPTSVVAQSTEELLGERRLQYQLAVRTHESAQAAHALVDRQFNTALNDITRTTRDGDASALQQALANAQARSVSMADATRRVEEAADSLRSVRQELIQVLIVRQVELIALADGAPTAAERRGYDDLLEDVTNQLTELETQAEDDTGLGPVAMPDIGFDPRDGPTELLGKAEILERTAARIDTLVQATAEEIRQLEDRLTRDRRRADFLSGTGRFGDRLAPTGVGRGGDPAVQSSDSTATGRRPLTLEERIQARREDRDRLITIRDQYLLRARAFRERVRTRG